jgi:tetratricopeptide (TPR) repeat protein
MKHLLYLTIAFTLTSCISENNQSEGENNHDQVQKNPEERIAELEAIVYSDTDLILDIPIAIELAGLYSYKAKKNPTDTTSADLLFKAGELYMNSKHGNKAIAEFKEVHARFPGSKQSSIARFLKGFVAETVLKDQDLAKRFYQEFLTAHPDHDFSDDARLSIEMLGMNDAELLERIKGRAES